MSFSFRHLEPVVLPKVSVASANLAAKQQKAWSKSYRWGYPLPLFSLS